MPIQLRNDNAPGETVPSFTNVGSAISKAGLLVTAPSVLVTTME